MIKKIVGYNGNIVFNKNYPDGVKRRQLDSRIIRNLVIQEPILIHI